MNLTARQVGLFEFVKEAHRGQLRKYTGEPYHTHPLAVAEIVSKYDDTPGLIEIALCHDLFEDTQCNENDLRCVLRELGYNLDERDYIVYGVWSLTDEFTSKIYTKDNRATRKQWEANRLSKIYSDYQSVKYADLIHNTESIVQFDKGFAKKYLAEKRDMLDVMRNGNLDLLMDCYGTLLKAERELKRTTAAK